MIVLRGDMRVILPALPDNSVDSALIDPPYHLDSIVKRFGSINAAPCQIGTDGAYRRAASGFMGKTWDDDIMADPEAWGHVLRVLKPGGHLIAFSHSRTYHRMASAIELAGFEIRDQIMWLYGSGMPKAHDLGDGWKTALKPGHEPVCLARKPIEAKSIRDNMLQHGVGGLNIEACGLECGRFPANVIHDGDILGEDYAKFFYQAKATKSERPWYCEPCGIGGASHAPPLCPSCGNKVQGHPTVKPQALMRYLCRLVTPPGGTILDPFAGSGSTLQAARSEGFHAIGVEQDHEYFKLIKRRLGI